jgi:hypothetical protein
MTTVSSSAKGTASATTARQVWGSFGPIHELQHPAAVGDWKKKGEQQ